METLLVYDDPYTDEVCIDWPGVTRATYIPAPAPPPPRGRRDLRRPQVNPNVRSLEYPMSYYMKSDDTVDPLPGCAHVSVGEFPNNIASYDWIHRDADDEGGAWRMLCRLTHGVYVFWTAWCDYTGFSCRGGFRAWAHEDPAMLVKYAMSDADYELYCEATLEVDTNDTNETNDAADPMTTLPRECLHVPVYYMLWGIKHKMVLTYDLVNYQVSDGSIDGPRRSMKVVADDGVRCTLAQYVSKKLRKD